MKKILIIDDSSLIRKSLQFCLSGRFEVLMAKDGKEGVACFENNFPDLVITDLNMPEMGGIEVTKAIRAHKRGAQIPIFILTTESRGKPIEEAKEAGATGWMVKPFEKERLLATITEILGL